MKKCYSFFGLFLTVLCLFCLNLLVCFFGNSIDTAIKLANMQILSAYQQPLNTDVLYQLTGALSTINTKQLVCGLLSAVLLAASALPARFSIGRESKQENLMLFFSAMNSLFSLCLLYFTVTRAGDVKALSLAIQALIDSFSS